MDAAPILVSSNLHVCGIFCPHVTRDDNGSYVCTLTGQVFGVQLSNGSFSNTDYVSDFGTPPPAWSKDKHQRKRKRILSWEELISNAN